MDEMKHPRMPKFDIQEYGKHSYHLHLCMLLCVCLMCTFVDNGCVSLPSLCWVPDPLLDSACMSPSDWVKMAEDLEKNCGYHGGLIGAP